MKKTSKKNCTIVINTSFDRELYNASALINSIKDFAGSANQYTIYVLFYDKTKMYVKEIFESMQTENIKINCIMDLYEKYPDLPVISKKMRNIFIPSILKKEKKIVFLSPNTIMQSDIADILDTNFDDKVVACSYDVYSNIIKKNEALVLFNTDVMLVNVTNWNRLMLTDACLSYIQRAPDEFNLTSLINTVCYNNIQDLGYEWNLQFWNTKEDFSEKDILKRHKAKIINFADDKPWVRPMMDKADLWWKYVRNTPLYEVIIYRNIFINLSKANFVRRDDFDVIEKKAETSFDYILIDRLKSEVDDSIHRRKVDSEILEKVISDDNLCSMMKRYVKLSLKYVFFYSKRRSIKKEMDELYGNILRIMSDTKL